MRRVICLHGFTGAADSWDEVVASLPAGLRIDCPPILGHGIEATTSSPTFECEVDRLARRIRGAGGAGVHLAGYSQGGRLAVGLLARHADLFASATLIGASPGLERAGDRQKRRAADDRWTRLLEDEGLERFLERWEALPLFATQRRLPAAKLEAQRTLRRRHRPEALARALRVLGLGRMPNYWPVLPGLDLPVHLMAGARDEKFRRIARDMAQHLPRATVEIVASAGHNLLLEAPRRIAAAISRALSPRG